MKTLDSPSTETTENSLFSERSIGATKARQDLAAATLAKFQQAQNDRVRQERQWYMNLAFYFGDQHARFRGTGLNYEMYVPKAPYYRARIVINHIRKIIRKDISRLTAQEPNAYIVPASIEDRDIFAAQAGEQIWNSIRTDKKLNKIYRKAVFWQTVCGNGFVKQYWDPTAQVTQGNDVLWGDVCICSETPFHIYVPDLRAEELEEQPYLFHVQVKHKDWIERTFGLDLSNREGINFIDEKLYSVLNINHQNNDDFVAVLEVWVKPGTMKMLPEGGMFTIAGTQIVQGYEFWPYSHNEYPFSKLDGIPTGKFYNDSLIKDLIPLQRELNRTRGQIIEAKNRMAKPQLVAEEGSIDPRRITSEPGLVITYRQGFQRPDPLPMQNLPSYVESELNRIYSDMADLSGQHEVTQGQTPPGVTAAVAISYLQEQDESILSTFYDSLTEAIEKTARQTLNYVKDYWDESRTVKITGLDGTFDVQAFRGSDLQGNTDIRIESGSNLPTSRAAKQAFILDLMKMGFIPPEKGLEVLEIGGLNKIYDQIQVDIRQAQRENLRMRIVTPEDLIAHEEIYRQQHPELLESSEGLPLQVPLIVPVNSWDNHALHIEEHNRYRKSQAFEMAPSEVKKLFEEHVRQHEEALIMRQVGNPLAPGLGSSAPGGASPEAPESSADARSSASGGLGDLSVGVPPEELGGMGGGDNV